MLENKIYQNVETIPKSYRKIVVKVTKRILLAHTHIYICIIHDRSLSWLGTGTSIKCGG